MGTGLVPISWYNVSIEPSAWHSERQMNKLKVLPQSYRGHIYRSKIEAKWAVFFTLLKIPYEYEPNAFDIGDGEAYIPDFFLPDQNAYVEVKGSRPDIYDPEGLRRWLKFAQQTEPPAGVREKRGTRCFLFVGDIPDWTQMTSSGVEKTGQYDPCNRYPDGIHWFRDSDYYWTQCEKCERFGIEFDGRSHRIGCGCDHGKSDKGYNADAFDLLVAYRQAREFRFANHKASIHNLRVLGQKETA